MIPTSLPIAEIAVRLSGDVVAANMVRAPMPGAGAGDRSLLLVKTAERVLVIPKAIGDAVYARDVKRKAEAHVAQVIGEAA